VTLEAVWRMRTVCRAFALSDIHLGNYIIAPSSTNNHSPQLFHAAPIPLYPDQHSHTSTTI
jgi:hypothetical protein